MYQGGHDFGDWPFVLSFYTDKWGSSRGDSRKLAQKVFGTAAQVHQKWDIWIINALKRSDFTTWNLNPSVGKKPDSESSQLLLHWSEDRLWAPKTREILVKTMLKPHESGAYPSKPGVLISAASQSSRVPSSIDRYDLSPGKITPWTRW